MAKDNVVVAKGFDIIGDIHGHIDALKRLFVELEYTEVNGLWSHPERKAIFVGDLVDRGPGQRELCTLVRNMIEVGHAEMCIGNHELNSVGFATKSATGGYLRKHSEKNIQQHQSFVDEYPFDSDAHSDVIAWFKQLPLWLELEMPNGDKARVIHAYWHSQKIELLKSFLQRTTQGWVLGNDFDHALFTKGEEAFEWVELLLKGPEIALPKGASYLDKGGVRRRQSRLKWWSTTTTWAESCLFGGAHLDGFDPHTEIEESAYQIYQDSTPVFFGHYWMNGPLRIQTPKVACLDWSVAKGGRLVAYRWDGESELTVEKMVAVSA